MRIGGPIGLGVIGAILMFAVGFDNIGGVSLATAGLIMLVGAAVWLVAVVAQRASGTTTASTQTVQHADGSVSEKRTTVESDTV